MELAMKILIDDTKLFWTLGELLAHVYPFQFPPKNDALETSRMNFKKINGISITITHQSQRSSIYAYMYITLYAL